MANIILFGIVTYLYAEKMNVYSRARVFALLKLILNLRKCNFFINMHTIVFTSFFKAQNKVLFDCIVIENFPVFLLINCYLKKYFFLTHFSKVKL